MIKKVHHVAIVVKNLDEMLAMYENLFDIKPSKIETVPDQGVKAAILPMNEGTEIENKTQAGFLMVEITAPEPGFYLFGNKLLSAKEIFIIGAFTIEAEAASDWPIRTVKFFLDDILIGEDTESPHSVYCAVKHEGLGTILARVECFNMNIAEDTRDVYYYKFL